MKFDLYSLGPREFENLVQSIAVAELGPHVSVFGAGPDGGREATFDHLAAVKAGVEWDGYGILQVKHKDKPAAPVDEATWLISEIRKEFKEWRESDKRNPKPQYVIFASNVTLSPVPGTGGFDRVENVMREECEKIGVQGWMIWHSENFNRFLEINSGIRRSYAAWILPGDVLASLYEVEQKRKKEVVSAIKNFLSREVLRDRYANLDQAGTADDRTIPLADVFVDLPISLSDEFNPDIPAKCLETLISACDAGQRPDDRQLNNGMPGNRFVLVGGPGQGKSTVSQLLCQLYRALLVKDTELYTRSFELRSAVDRISDLAARESLSPRARRWPIKIPLTSLADGLAKGTFRSVLEYVAQRVSAVASVEVTAADMKEWLADFPWLLILDGLDEVPGSSNRNEVLSCVNEFLLDADEVNADLLVVATTRPQGYVDEFSPKYYCHYSLLPLDKENALIYGQKLAQAKYGPSAEDKVHQLMRRLEQAAAEDSTAHLMTTPLQVTIVAVLLERMGKAPKDRYTLFADYYRVIYERELEKEGPASNLLRDRRSDIGAIHADIGLLLQTKSERSGDTESRLTRSELDVLISARLQDEGFKGEQLQSLTAAISTAALDRLVLLVPSRSDEVSFEIRSLQEFWAADAIMNCPESDIPDRLRAMSVSAHWRNVLLFALGNIFEKRKVLRDAVVTLVAELNSSSEQYGHLQRRVLTGSRLAVEILRDGMARAPRYESTLLEQALRVLDLPLSGHVSMLASSISPEGMSVARDFLQPALARSGCLSESVLVFLGVRASHGDQWAVAKLRDKYAQSTSQDRKRFLEIANHAESVTLSAWAMPSMADPENTFAAARSLRRFLRASGQMGTARWERSGSNNPFPIPEWAASVSKILGTPSARSAGRLQFSTGGINLSLSAIPCGSPSSYLQEAIDAGFPKNHWLSRVHVFSVEPSKEALARVVESAGPSLADYRPHAANFPWVVLYALNLRDEKGEAAPGMIRAGYLGDADDWCRLETAWQDSDFSTLTESSFDSWRVDREPFFPFQATRFSATVSERGMWGQGDFFHVLDLAATLPDSESRRRLISAVFNLLSRASGRSFKSSLSLPISERIFECLPEDSQLLLAWIDGVETDETWIEFLNKVGLGLMVGYHWAPSLPRALADDWVHDFSLSGIGRIVMSSFVGGFAEQSEALIRVEWQRVKGDPVVDPIDKCLVALAYLSLGPVDEPDERDRFLRVLGQVVGEGKASLLHVLGTIYIGHEVSDYNFVVDLVDVASGSLRPGERRFVFDFLVGHQSSQWTEISFESMRPR
ncbi:NACHT domain-containing protein [Streptomyces sp. NPDC004285]